MKESCCCERIRLITLALFSLFVIGFAQEVSAQGGVAGAFLRVGVGARAKAMGDAYVALARGIEASYYNPAGLPFLENKEIMASYRFLSLDRQFTFIGFGMPVQPEIQGSEEEALAGGFALSWLRAGIDDIDGRDTDGQSLGGFSNSENAFVFSFALNPAEVLALGLSVKVLWNRFPDIGIDGETISASSVGFDFGARLQPLDWVTLGISVRDISSKYKWNTDKLFGEDGSEVINKFPKIIRAGFAVNLPQVPGLILAFDFEDSNELDSEVHIGAEGNFKQNFVLRGGFDDGALTAGAGYDFSVFGKMSQLNYAFTAPGDRPEEEHVFTWVFQF
ncbi:PorV/PorQ family protein [candidate division KSB1 bacterium]|nr:PorV/PorQ family protein [candidate division KSB1 bacterium]NIR71035.1 PorV/PorQ family protein [candidate division KSB1 bacterium]NIS26120.1 PorV/PorQ family protein [candidate division KSB1 bacterium]NIT72914.1 PorV/PorQ family protein [candidate division KSB1 bacterium]NIU26759.1 PorV/PorQ family protein [candidate division KSB1 bacterium]